MEDLMEIVANMSKFGWRLANNNNNDKNYNNDNNNKNNNNSQCKYEQARLAAGRQQPVEKVGETIVCPTPPSLLTLLLRA